MGTRWVAIFAMLLVRPLLLSADLPELTSIAPIAALSPAEAAKGYPVKLLAVVTFCKPELATLFIHDGERGIYVARPVLPYDAGPRLGDQVEVRGITQPGDFSPSITGARGEQVSIKLLSHGEPPEPEPIPGPELGVPERDCDWVSVEAEVIEVSIRYGDLVVECRSGPFDFFILMKGPLPQDSVPWGMAESRIRVRGVVCSSFNSMRQMTRRFLRVTSLADIESMGSAFDRQSPVEIEQVNELFRIGGPGPADLVRIRGVTSLAIPGRGYYLHTAGGSIWVQTAQPLATQPGTAVEVVGRPRAGQAKPFLHARSSTLLGVTTAPVPVCLKAAAAVHPRYDSELVSTDGELLGHQRSDDGEILELRDGEVIFRGMLPRDEKPHMAQSSLLPGSRLRVTGVAQIAAFGTNDPMQEAHSLTLRLRGPADLQVLSEPPFWSTRRAFAAAAAVIAGMLVIFALIRSRRLREQEAQRREFDAVLAERGRFAREIHDSLAQGLTSISLQLECIPEDIQSDPAMARHHVAKARGLVSDSLKGARRTIWNLRPLALGEADLPTALQRFTKDLADAGRVTFSQEIEGTPRPLKPEIEDALLRIGQEALTNAVRHGSPGRVNTRLRFGPDWFNLIVRDDGCGFDVRERAGKGFGLTSMQERVAALDGGLTIESRPGEGTETSVTVRI